VNLNPLSSIFDLGKTIIQRVVPDKAAQAAAVAELEKMQLSGDLAAMAGQVDINKIEAANANMFVSGWRPAVGWTCCAGLAYQFLVRPLFIGVSSGFGHAAAFPDLDMGTLMVLLTGMLGFGGLRSFEKINNVAAK
jgi:hypothetical protein